jgi:hypothetical protein
MAQVVEFLPNKLKDLRSNSSAAKRKKLCIYFCYTKSLYKRRQNPNCPIGAWEKDNNKQFNSKILSICIVGIKFNFTHFY